ncbi:MAG: cyclic nucleotide-binding domain-containing protein [Chloroflexota bacterium]
MPHPLLPGSSPVFHDLAQDAIEQIAGRLHPESFQTGQVVFHQGERGRCLYIVRSGVVEVRLDARDGGAPIARLTRGDCLGEMALMTGQPRSATAVAVADCLLLRLDEEDFRWAMARFPTLSYNIGRILSERLLATTRREYTTHKRGRVFLVEERPRDVAATLGANLARALAAQTGRSVALVDLHGSTVRASDRYHFRRLARLVVVGQRRRSATRDDVDGQVWATRSEPFGPGGVRPDDLVAGLNWLREAFDFLVVSVPRGGPPIGALVRPERTIAEIAADEDASVISADAEPLVTTAASLPTLRDRADVEQRLGRRPLELVALAERDLSASLNRGTPLWDLAPEGATSLALGRIARDLAGLKVGLALGAGGAKGFAHIGVLRVLQQARVPIDIVAGTSMGSLIGAAYASGLAADEIDHLLRGLFTPDAVQRLFNFTLGGSTDAGGLELAAILAAAVGDRTFADLTVPLLVVATDLEERREAIFQQGRLEEALHASSAQPGAFPPVEIDGRGYIDGVVLAPVPTGPLEEAGAGVVIGVNLYGRDQLVSWPDPAAEPVNPAPLRIPRMLESLFRTQDLQQVDLSEQLMKRVDVAVTPRFGPCTWRDFYRADQFVAAGEAAAEAALPRVRALLAGTASPGA